MKYRERGNDEKGGTMEEGEENGVNEGEWDWVTVEN